jgi:hypothetical protein
MGPREKGLAKFLQNFLGGMILTLFEFSL